MEAPSQAFQFAPILVLPARRVAGLSQQLQAPAATVALHANDNCFNWSLCSCRLCTLAFSLAAGARWAQRRRRTRARRQGQAKGHSKIACRAIATDTKEDVSLKLFSPAKINLFLRITQKRPDGYHGLASLFHAVSFGDTVELTLLPKSAQKDELECNLPGVPLDDSNLVIRALNLFRKHSGVERFFKICLSKSIPTQAGMGGGSSNAATVLYGANELCGRPACPSDLIQWTEDPVIGSDATFFLSDGAAFCTGRGEILAPVAPLPIPSSLPVYLVKPKYGLSTPQVFKTLDLSTTSRVQPEELLSAFENSGIDHNFWINDLERPAFEVCPELGDLKSFLARAEWGFRAVLMSGSGTTIFCLGEPKGGAAQLEAAARQNFDIEGIWKAQLLRKANGKWYDT